MTGFEGGQYKGES